MSKTIESHRNWKAYWQRQPPAHLLSQVGRTIGGKPISAGQLALLVSAVIENLSLGSDDILLDLCCGNGLVTSRLAGLCRWTLGIDYSLELIAVARAQHAASNVLYLHRDAAQLDRKDFPLGPPAKICLNGGLQYFTRNSLIDLLLSLRRIGADNFALFCSDIPDANRLSGFYNTPDRRTDLERRKKTGDEAIGTWWDRHDLCKLMGESGYRGVFVEQDSGRDSAHYRFDLIAFSRSVGESTSV